MVKEITVQELKQLFDNKENFQLIDVREEFEHKEANIGGELIPLGHVYYQIDKIDKNKKVIIYCRSGQRSGQAVELIESISGLENLYNLKGGILAWASEIEVLVQKN